jgi:hypothetical protein
MAERRSQPDVRLEYAFDRLLVAKRNSCAALTRSALCARHLIDRCTLGSTQHRNDLVLLRWALGL